MLVLMSVKQPPHVKVSNSWPGSVTKGARLYQGVAGKTTFDVIYKYVHSHV